MTATTTTFQARNNATAPRTFFLMRLADGAFYPAIGRGTLGDNHTTDTGDVMMLTERDGVARRKDLNGGGRGARYVVACL